MSTLVCSNSRKCKRLKMDKKVIVERARAVGIIFFRQNAL